MSSIAGPSDSAADSADGRSIHQTSVSTATSTGDLLRYLPLDCRDNPSIASPVQASYTIPGERMDWLARSSVAPGASRAVFFKLGFATLLARLTGQESITLHNRSENSSVETLVFTPQQSFRTLLTDRRHSQTAPDQPCAAEFFYVEGGALEPVLAGPVLRMTISVSEGYRSERTGLVSLVSTTGLWSSSLLHLWLRYFDHLLTTATTSPDLPWKALPLLEAAETAEFYQALNQTAQPFASDSLVHDMVARQAEQTPSAIAIASEWRRFTYRQLQEKTEVIAQHLQKIGAGPGRAVAVCLERSIDLPVALLAVLKSGSFSVPLDPQEAPQRLATILAECAPVAIITDRSLAALPSDFAASVLYLDEIANRPEARFQSPSGLTADQPAYTIYTSGTTGKPKGVTITHGSLTNVLQSFLQEPGFQSIDRLLAVSPISFDIAMLEMFLPLLVGGTVVVADRLIAADPFRLATMLSEYEITVLQATPSTWRLLQSSHWKGKPNLRMISGGEALPRDLANRLLPLGAALWNCYGPTETTIWSSVLRLREEPGIVPIGPPLSNTSFYVLDEAGELLPPGVAGELYIGGAGVSSGYVNRPQLSQERFLPDPFSNVVNARMFRTGDLVRLGNGNEFEFLGRLDNQVKLRGYRIELGEIESVMRTYPGIGNAVAGIRDNAAGEAHLVAWFTASQQHADLLLLREYLSQQLPSYMLPSRFVRMDAMPLTTSGKIDRNALLKSDLGAAPAHHSIASVKPATDLEQKLLNIFREVLGTTAFGVTDSFFDFGGYSLLTVRLFTRIHRKLGVNLPISLLFDAPTVRELAEIMVRPHALPTIVPIRPQGQSAPLFVIHSYLLYGVLPEIVEPGRPVYGVREELGASATQTVEDRAADYVREILHVYPDGPLLLTGWCAAGSLTVEIARQLRLLGHRVGLVALFDAERPGYQPPVRGYRWARFKARLQFHSHRLRGGSRQQRLEYIRLALLHRRDAVLEALFLRHPAFFFKLRRWFGFSLPDAVFNNTWAGFAVQNYAPENYPGKIVLFRATDIPQLPGGDETLGWNEVVEHGVEVVYVPGDHETMFHDPHVEVFRKYLRQALQLAG